MAKRYTQPQNGPAQIDWSNPITRGLVDANNFSQGTIDAVSNLQAASSGSLTKSLSSAGAGLSFSSAAVQHPPPVPTGEMTVLAVVIPTTLDANDRGIAHRRNGSTIGSTAIHGSNASGAWFIGANSTQLKFYGWGTAGATVFNVVSSTLPLNAPSIVVATLRTYSTNGAAIYVNGALAAQGNKTAAFDDYATWYTEVGGRNSNNSARYWAGGQTLFLHWSRALSDAEIASLSANPWQIFKPATTLLAVVGGGGPTSYTLSGAVGSYAVTGNAATLSYTPGSSATNYTLSGASGAYAVTGSAATFKVAHVLSGAAGSYAVTGNASTFKVGHALSGASGSYAVTGYAATLVRTSTGPTAYAITGDSGAYLLTGNDAGFDWSGAVKPIQYYGGGPGKLKDDKSSYWHRLLSPPAQSRLEAIEPEAAEVIEAQAVAVVEQSVSRDFRVPDAQAEMQRAMNDLGIAYKQAYKEIYLELVAEMQQAQEDEQIAQIVAMLI